MPPSVGVGEAAEGVERAGVAVGFGRRHVLVAGRGQHGGGAVGRVHLGIRSVVGHGRSPVWWSPTRRRRRSRTPPAGRRRRRRAPPRVLPPHGSSAGASFGDVHVMSFRDVGGVGGCRRRRGAALSCAPAAARRRLSARRRRRDVLVEAEQVRRVVPVLDLLEASVRVRRIRRPDRVVAGFPGVVHVRAPGAVAGHGFACRLRPLALRWEVGGVRSPSDAVDDVRRRAVGEGGGVRGDTSHRAAEVVQVELGLHRQFGGAAMEVGERGDGVIGNAVDER